MDNSLQELENELKALQPRRARAEWMDQIHRELAAELPASARPVYSTATNLRSWKWLGWRTASLAAAFALVVAGVIGFRAARPDPSIAIPPARVTAEVPIYQPIAAANVLYDLKDEGTVNGDATARQVRARYVDTYTWKNPRTNASIKWTVPRDEVRVVPASFTLN
jgi:hypothetical protein